MTDVQYNALGASHSPALPGDAAALVQQLEQMRQENDALGRELLRCYEQINLVFEITENIAKLKDPESIQDALLQRLGAMIGAGAMYFQRNGSRRVIEPADSLGQRVELPAEHVFDALRNQIEQVRQNARALVPGRDDTGGPALEGTHAMVVPLQQHEAEPAVVVVLRHPSEPPFDSGDMLASESVLAYGGQIINNVLMMRNLQQMAVETVRALANAIDAKDNYTCGHSERVGWLARLVGVEYGLSETDLERLEWAGILHDVGKIGIPEAIINKPGKLTEDEYALMKRHPRMSYDVLKPVARLGPVLDGVLHHHENWDGSGYPDGLHGEEISLAARIIRAADTFDALTSTRSYRKGFTIEKAFAILREESGRGMDPRVVETFVAAFEQYARVKPADFAHRFPHIAEVWSPPEPGGADGVVEQDGATAAKEGAE